MKRLRFFTLYIVFQLAYQLYSQTPRNDAVINHRPDYQASIAGEVLDASNGAGLPNVNVFLDGTTLGVASDKEGFFVIRNVPRGAYELVVSMVGYERQVVKLEVFEEKNYELTVMLKPVAIEIGTVEVTAKDPVEWKKNFEEFRKKFLGETKNANACVIQNPEVMDFRTNGDLLEIAYHVSLTVENRALGYRIEFLLEQFRSDGVMLQYSAKTRFEDIQPTGEDEYKQWQENRKRAYAGSCKHFLTALIRGTSYAEGFRVQSVPSLRLRTNFRRSIDLVKLVQDTRYGFQKKLSFADFLEITYLLEPAEPAFQFAVNAQGHPLTRQVSWLQMNRLTALIDVNGNILEPFSLKKAGYWAFERIADLLPTDYVPE